MSQYDFCTFDIGPAGNRHFGKFPLASKYFSPDIKVNVIINMHAPGIKECEFLKYLVSSVHFSKL